MDILPSEGICHRKLYIEKTKRETKTTARGIAMNLFILFMGLAAMSGIVAVVTAFLITAALDRRNIKTNFIFLGLFIFKYVKQYRDITLQETGRVGVLFYCWIVSINLALVSVVAAFIAN